MRLRRTAARVIHPRVESGLLRRADPAAIGDLGVVPGARAARMALLAQATVGTATMAPKIPNSNPPVARARTTARGWTRTYRPTTKGWRAWASIWLLRTRTAATITAATTPG